MVLNPNIGKLFKNHAAVYDAGGKYALLRGLLNLRPVVPTDLFFKFFANVRIKIETTKYFYVYFHIYNKNNNNNMDLKYVYDRLIALDDKGTEITNVKNNDHTQYFIKEWYFLNNYYNKNLIEGCFEVKYV